MHFLMAIVQSLPSYDKKSNAINDDGRAMMLKVKTRGT
jgi:hypothetical protein